MIKNIPSCSLIELAEEFIRKSKSGHRRYGNGRRISAGTIENYDFLLRHLRLYEAQQAEPLRVRSETKLSKKQFLSEKRYWKKFYTGFSQSLHREGCFDNYVGMMMKNVRAILHYAQSEKMIATGTFRKQLYVTKEEIPIITLLPDRLQLLIQNEDFRDSLNPTLQTVLDIFVLGCSVALRFSDLIAISQRNIEKVGEGYHLCVSAKKTGTETRVKLPDYARAILQRHTVKGKKTIFPKMSLNWFNIQVRALCEAANWTEECGKYRLRNGRRLEVKNQRTGRTYRFCDLVSSHVMRRTAITTMLMNGVPEMVVRKISGHSATSPAFQRYVNLVQSYMDAEVEKHFSRLTQNREPRLSAHPA